MAREFDWEKVKFSKESKSDAYERGLDSMKLADRSVVIGEHGRGEAVGFSLWTTHGEGKAGIAAVRSMQQLYATIAATHPDVVKYKPTIDPIVKAADDWDAATFFYQDVTAVDLGRQAEVVAQQMAKEYGYPFVPNPTLASGVVEQLQQSTKSIEKSVQGAGSSAATFASYLPWILVGGAALLGLGIYKIMQGDTGKTLAGRVRIL